jgi:hypothetical protein
MMYESGGPSGYVLDLLLSSLLLLVEVADAMGYIEWPTDTWTVISIGQSYRSTDRSGHDMRKLVQSAVCMKP